MMTWYYIVGSLSLVLAAFLLWQETRRPDRRRLTWRLTATVLAITALAGMELPLTYNRYPAVSGKEAIFLTEGYNTDSLSRYEHEHPGIGIVRQPAPGVDRWHVFGYGLTTGQWAALQPPRLIFHPSAPAEGFIDVGWRQQLRPGERLEITGQLRGTGKILLLGWGTVLDSVIRKDNASKDTAGARFSLNTIPAQTGRVVYRLALVRGTDTLDQENIPVDVQPGRQLRVLILASSPDFENTFLVNWLSAMGYQAAVRTAVSKGRYQQTYVNMRETPLEELSSSLLGAFDLVIADAKALPAKGTEALGILRRQVEQKGLGLLIRTDSSGGAGIGGQGEIEITATKDSARLAYIRDRPDIRSLVKDSLGHMVVGCVLDGAGRVVFSTRNKNYALVMAGRQQLYNQYWSMLLGMASKEEQSKETWSWQPALPRVREQAELTVQRAAGETPQGIAGAAVVYLAQSATLPFYWKGAYWPEKDGWQTVKTLQGDTAWWYVWPADSWKNVYREQRQRETMVYMTAQGHSTVTITDGRVSIKALIPKAWFYTIFLLSALYLWVERKLGGMNG